jgi:hypothetical protein
MQNKEKYLKIRRIQTSKIEKILNFFKKIIMFYEFDTIKHIKKFTKYLDLCLKIDGLTKNVRNSTKIQENYCINFYKEIKKI